MEEQQTIDLTMKLLCLELCKMQKNKNVNIFSEKSFVFHARQESTFAKATLAESETGSIGKIAVVESEWNHSCQDPIFQVHAWPTILQPYSNYKKNFSCTF